VRDCGHILVVAGDPQLRGLLTVLLSSAGLVTENVSGGEEALKAARSQRPSLVLLDVCLPDINGYEVCREFKDEFGEELPVIFVSGERTDPIDRVAGLLVGADDYVVRPFDSSELIARVRRFVTRPRNASPDGVVSGPHRDLTRRELQVLELLAEGRRPFDIARELVISRKTVASHIQQVLAKLGVNSQAQAVAFAYRRGLIEPPNRGG
jgi:DNA-binding NarL/FixJ family response regulator